MFLGVIDIAEPLEINGEKYIISAFANTWIKIKIKKEAWVDNLLGTSVSIKGNKIRIMDFDSRKEILTLRI